MIPIDREGGDAGERALDTAAGARDGELFGIYPEGTRSRDGRLYRGHTGPARLALRTGVPIIPIGIIGRAR
jgi:1-acyl-sn-glycerol-3-phosphate acyltransferase